MGRLKIGFIGAGGIAGLHADRLKNVEDAEIAAFADIVRGKAEEKAAKYGGRAYTDWREMLSREELDVVYICTPPYARGSETIEAAEKGIHVFVEKPIALSLDLAVEIAEAVERTGVKSQVGYVWRHTSGINEARRLVKAGELGRIGLFAAKYLGDMLWVARTEHWWKDIRKSGGHVVEQVTHTYDSLRYIMGEVEEVCAYSNRFASLEDESWSVEDAHVAILKLRGGAIACVYSTACAPAWLQGWCIVGEKGLVELPDPFTVELRIRGEEPKKMEARGDPYLAESLELFRAIKEDSKTRAPIREGVETLKLTLAVRRSFESSGEKVRLD